MIHCGRQKQPLPLRGTGAHWQAWPKRRQLRHARNHCCRKLSEPLECTQTRVELAILVAVVPESSLEGIAQLSLRCEFQAGEVRDVCDRQVIEDDRLCTRIGAMSTASVWCLGMPSQMSSIGTQHRSRARHHGAAGIHHAGMYVQLRERSMHTRSSPRTVSLRARAAAHTGTRRGSSPCGELASARVGVKQVAAETN